MSAASPSRAAALWTRFGRLFRQALEISGAGLAVQALGAVTTLAFVHLLPVRDYAALALCLSMVSFVSVASDLGLTASIGYFWREAGRGQAAFADRFAAIRHLRSLLVVAVGIVAGVALAVLLRRQGMAAGTIALLIGLVLVIAVAQLSGNMILVTMRLAGWQRRAYSADLAGAAVKAGLAAASIALFPHSWTALGCLAAGALVTFAMTRTPFEPAAAVPGGVRRDLGTVFRYILPTMPYVLLFAMQDLVIYWCATFRGGTAVVAQTFALGRLSAIFLLLGTLMSNLIMPHVVNSADDRHALRKAMIPIGGLVAICLALVVAAWIAPGLFLLLLGKPYAGLEHELLLALSAAGLQLIAQSINGTTRVMGWVRLEPAMTVVQAAVLIGGALFLPLETTHDVLVFSNLLATSFLLQNLVILLLGPRTLLR